MTHVRSREEVIVETLGEEDLKRLLEDHKRLLILYGFANAVSTILDIELLLHEVMNVVFGLVDAERGAIFLLDSKTGQLVRRVSRVRPLGNKGMDAVSQNEVIDLVFQEKTAVLTPDAVADSRFKKSHSVQSQTIRSCMCVPLASQHRVLGILYVDSRLQAGNFSKEQLTLVSGISNHTAVALENIESVHRLKEERKRVEDILKALPVAIISIDEKGVISFANPQAGKLFGIPEEDCLGHLYASFFEAHSCSPLRDLVASALRKGGGVTLEEVACGGPEKEMLLQMNIVPLREGTAQKGVLVALDDVTEKKRLEREVANAEKLSAIGEMAAGLIHEINNPLSIISGRAQLLVLEKEKDAEVTRAATLIREQVDRASAITEKLLSFARQKPLQLSLLSLHEFLNQCLETMEEQFVSKKVSVEKTFSEAAITIMGDKEQLEEVFINLARNAIQAMPEGGRFIVATQREMEHAVISLTDTGCGIPPEHFSKIFLPFFTTKSRGTGLGLSIVHGIVKNHGGMLRVESQMGKGSTFVLTFPLSKEAMA